MQRFVLFLGFPTYSLSVVLATLLLSTGVGSALSGRVRSKPIRGIVVAAATLGLFVAALVYGLPPVLTGLLDQSLPIRVAVTTVALFPLGLLLGMFFPLGIRLVEAFDGRLVPWAWAVNGCTTVVGTIVAAMLGMSIGFSAVMLTAAALYVGSACALAALHERTPA
jgi:hypothetical protein